jgi:hypothetical protein
MTKAQKPKPKEIPSSKTLKPSFATNRCVFTAR